MYEYRFIQCNDKNLQTELNGVYMNVMYDVRGLNLSGSSQYCLSKCTAWRLISTKVPLGIEHPSAIKRQDIMIKNVSYKEFEKYTSLRDWLTDKYVM